MSGFGNPQQPQQPQGGSQPSTTGTGGGLFGGGTGTGTTGSVFGGKFSTGLVCFRLVFVNREAVAFDRRRTWIGSY